MIRFEPRPKPPGFEARVEARGAAWLAAHPTGRPPAYWGEFAVQVADAFGSLCAYSAMYEPVGTVDHFVSIDEDRRRAYDWTNYRLCQGWINASKQALRSTEILDPFEVVNEWFEVLLPSMQLVLTAQVPSAARERAQRMLDRLHLGHDERVVRQRRAWYELYQAGLSLAELAKKAPLIAAAIRRQLAGPA